MDAPAMPGADHDDVGGLDLGQWRDAYLPPTGTFPTTPST